MSHNSFGLNLQELFEGLRNLPPELQQEGGEIVFANADKAAEEIAAGYPSRTGDLKNHIKVTHMAERQFSTTAIVKNTSKHASIFENGTQARHNALGANRGSMPAGNVFVPAIIRRRRTMYEILKDLVASKGLEVSGDA